MSNIIGFIGKGGTGKTTITALFLKYIMQKNINPVLVIDSDPNSCLGDLLNLKIDNTIGNIKNELFEQKYDFNPSGISKTEFCEYALNNAIIESNGFDMVVMGRPEGPGCYCYINNIVKTMINKLQRNYKMVIVDCEAGLEHLSRKTLNDISTAFIVSDISKKGILTGIRQTTLMNELNINTKNNYLIINNYIEKENINNIKTFISSNQSDIKYIGAIPHDEIIVDYEFNSKSILSIPNDTSSYVTLKNILDDKTDL